MNKITSCYNLTTQKGGWVCSSSITLAITRTEIRHPHFSPTKLLQLQNSLTKIGASCICAESSGRQGFPDSRRFPLPTVGGSGRGAWVGYKPSLRVRSHPALCPALAAHTEERGFYD